MRPNTYNADSDILNLCDRDKMKGLGTTTIKRGFSCYDSPKWRGVQQTSALYNVYNATTNIRIDVSYTVKNLKGFKMLYSFMLNLL